MPRSQQPKGGSLPGGTPAKSEDPRINPGWGVRKSIKQRISELPQVKSGEWSQSYLIEQVLLNHLGLPADYNLADLAIVFYGNIIE